MNITPYLPQCHLSKMHHGLARVLATKGYEFDLQRLPHGEFEIAVFRPSNYDEVIVSATCGLSDQLSTITQLIEDAAKAIGIEISEQQNQPNEH
jgi:hypothetical protein